MGASMSVKERNPGLTPMDYTIRSRAARFKRVCPRAPVQYPPGASAIGVAGGWTSHLSPPARSRAAFVNQSLTVGCSNLRRG